MSEQIKGPCTYCGNPDHWRPDCKLLMEWNTLANKSRQLEQELTRLREQNRIMREALRNLMGELDELKQVMQIED